MIKQVFFLIIPAVLFLASCGEENTPIAPLNDSAKKDTAKHMSTGKGPVMVEPYDTTTFADGDVLIRYDNGVIKMTGTKRGGKRIGTWRFFHPNGHLWSEGTYVDGKRDGKGYTYFENGKKWSEGSYKNNVFVGVWTYWDSLGNVAGKFDYGNGTESPKAIR